MRGAGLVGALALLAISRAAAQGPARLEGRVVDAVSQVGVGGAEVRAGDRLTTTDIAGAFAFGGVLPGRVELRVRRIGYAPLTRVVDLVPGLERSVTLALQPAALRLDSIVAVTQPGAIAIGGDDLVRRGNDLARALDGWEGVVVRRTSNGPAAPQVRGGGPEEVLVLVDGFPVNDPLTGRADLRRISSREVASVTLVPGAQTVRSGSRAVAGVLLIETRHEIHPEGAAWAASYGERGARLGGSTGGLTVTASGERLADDFPYTVPAVRGGGEATRGNAGGEQYNAALTLTGPVEVVARATASERGLPGTTTNPTPSAHGGDRSVQVGARTTGHLAVSASVEWIETTARDPAPPTGLPYDSDTHGVGATGALGHRVPVSVGPWGGSLTITAEGRADRFGGDEVRSGTSFTQAALHADARLTRGTATRWSLAPAVRLDGWTGAIGPRLSARVDAGWQRGGTAITLGAGSAVTPPVLADLFFREGVGVRVNPDLRPERVRWEIEGSLRHELPSGPAVGLRLFAGQVADMIIWAPDFRFIWSPRNFDVVRRGGELTLDWAPRRDLRLTGGGTYAAVTYDTPGGAQVEYRPRVTYDGAAIWSPGLWAIDLRWHRIGRRYPNSAGTNPRDAFDLLDAGLERRVGGGLVVRGEVRDLTDERAEFLAGYPTPGRAFALTLTMVVP